MSVKLFSRLFILLIICALAVFLYEYLNTTQTPPPPSTTYLSVVSSGGGVVRQPVQEEQKIVNVKVCKERFACDDNSGLWSGNITLYWEVDNGVGCCNGFYCDKNAFINYCLEPFSLYELYFNNHLISVYNSSTYEYSCSYETPYNYVFLQNIQEGEHTLRIVQKDCNTVVDEKVIEFSFTRMGEGFVYEGGLL